MITLRPDDQEPFVANLRASLAALRREGKPQRVLGVAPCGFGKTVCFSYMAMRASARGVRVALLVHRKELVDQVSDTLRRFAVPHGIIAAGYAGDPRQLVQVASVFTLARRLDRTHKPGLIICDETHHCVLGSTWGDIIEEWSDVPMVGVTASPIRLSGEGFDTIFGDMVVGPSVSELIAAGHLSPYRLFAPTNIDRSQMHHRGGEIVAEEMSEETKRVITGSALEHYAKLVKGAPAIAFTHNVASAHLLAEQFRAQGWKAAAVDGKMEDAERRRVIADCRAGRLNVMTSNSLVNEGLDIGGLHAAILLRPTDSLGLYIQQVGRAIRTAPGKAEAIILDHVGNTALHGLPDADREWTLKGRETRAREAMETPITTCKMCFRTLPQGTAKCPCGYVFEAQVRKIDEIEGELTEVDVLAQRRLVLQEQSSARSLDALIELGIKRHGAIKGPRWAKHVHDARVAKEARRRVG